MKVKEFKSFDEYENYVESSSFNELVPTIVIDDNYCAIDFTTYCKSWKTAIRRAMKIFIKYEDVYNWLDAMKESCENNCFIDRSVYEGKYTGDYTFGVEEVSDGVFYIYLKYRTTEVANEETKCKETEKSIIDTIISDDNNAYQTAKVTKTKHSILEVMQCLMCPADREGNRCGGKQWCKQTWKRYDAIVNPEWHHISLATLANIDNDMLDEKRRHYMKVYRMSANVINSIYKCNKLTSIDKLRTNLIQTVRTMAKNEKIEWALVQYVKAKIDNCYLVNGLQSSLYSKTYGHNKSRSYTKTFFI